MGSVSDVLVHDVVKPVSYYYCYLAPAGNWRHIRSLEYERCALLVIHS